MLVLFTKCTIPLFADEKCFESKPIQHCSLMIFKPNCLIIQMEPCLTSLREIRMLCSAAFRAELSPDIDIVAECTFFPLASTYIKKEKSFLRVLNNPFLPPALSLPAAHGLLNTISPRHIVPGKVIASFVLPIPPHPLSPL